MNSLENHDLDNYHEILNQFRDRLSDLLKPNHTDAILLRWLRAKNFNVAEAEENFRGDHSTRKFYRFNTILDWYEKPEVFKLYEATTFIGFAKDGSGVRYVAMDFDYYGFLHSASFWDIEYYLCYVMDIDLKTLKEENSRTGRNNDQIMFILDMKMVFLIHQFTYREVIESALDFLRLFQNHYPEIWKYVFFVNVPPLFSKIYNILKPALREILIKKLKIVTKENTKELLRTYIDDDVLPAFLGGQRVDSTGDPYCTGFIKQGGTIPEKYYFKNCLHFIDLADPGVKSTVINARRLFNFPVVVKETGTRIKFEIRTENGAIDFLVLFREFDEYPKEIYSPTTDEYQNTDKSNFQVVGVKVRIQSHIAPCNVIAVASKAGIYILQFDNTRSWFTSRKLFYRVTLLPPENSTN